MLDDERERKRVRVVEALDRANERGFSDSQIATKCGITKQAVTGWRKNGSISPAKLATLADLSRLTLHYLVTGENNQIADGDGTEYPVEAFSQDDDGPDPEYVRLPVLKLELAAGDGASACEEVQAKSFKFTKEYLRSKGVSQNSAKVVFINGNSHSPLLNPGDPVAVNLAEKSVSDGLMYAFRDLDMLRIKVLFRIPGGGLRLRSFNQSDYPDEELSADQVRDRIDIIGRVFWSGRDW